MNRAHRQLPPYARDILAARQSGRLHGWWGTSPNGQHPTLIICVGSDAWRVARQWAGRRLVTLLPPDGDPGLFDWRCLAGADPVLLWRCGVVDRNVLVSVLTEVMRDGTDRVLDVATGNRYVARVEEVNDERAA